MCLICQISPKDYKYITNCQAFYSGKTAKVYSILGVLAVSLEETSAVNEGFFPHSCKIRQDAKIPAKDQDSHDKCLKGRPVTQRS
jgi:hypothetical protein